MIRDALRAATDFVASHTRITLLVMLLVSAAVLAGIPQLDTGSSGSADPEAFDHLERVQKMDYVDDH